MGANPAPKYPGQIPGCTEKPTAQGEPSYADLEERQCFPGFRKTQPGRLLRFSNHSQPKGSGRSIICVPTHLGSHLWFTCGFLHAEFCGRVSVLTTLMEVHTAPIRGQPMGISWVLLHGSLIKILLTLFSCGLTVSR